MAGMPCWRAACAVDWMVSSGAWIRRARVVRSAESPMAWEIIIDEVAHTEAEPLSVQIAKGTVLYQTRLQDYIQLLQV